MSHARGYLDFKGDTTKEEVLAELDSFAFDPRETDGYHGNLTFHDKVYASREKAMRAIDEYDKGFYDDHAVYYREKIKFENPKVEEEIEKVKKRKEDYLKEHGANTFKFDYVTCKECGSKLRREYLKNSECPLCGSLLLSRTSLEKIAKYDNKILELQGKCYKDVVKLLVKYEYHC